MSYRWELHIHTHTQIAFLRKLGYDDEIRDKAHASELIEELKK